MLEAAAQALWGETLSGAAPARKGYREKYNCSFNEAIACASKRRAAVDTDLRLNDRGYVR